MKSVQVFRRHLELSVLYLSEACSGKLSLRGCLDAALDAGYFALLSVLTEEERRA